MPPQTPKLIELAQDSIRVDIEKLMENDSVKYLTNIDELEALKEERTLLEERLKEIDSVKEQIKELEEQAFGALKGNDHDKLQAELERLTKTKQTVSDIKHISELRTELEIIEDTISYNENILRQLRNFKNMSSEQFQKYINMIFY